MTGPCAPGALGRRTHPEKPACLIVCADVPQPFQRTLHRGVVDRCHHALPVAACKEQDPIPGRGATCALPIRNALRGSRQENRRRRSIATHSGFRSRRAKCPAPCCARWQKARCTGGSSGGLSVNRLWKTRAFFGSRGPDRVAGVLLWD